MNSIFKIVPDASIYQVINLDAFEDRLVDRINRRIDKSYSRGAIVTHIKDDNGKIVEILITLPEVLTKNEHSNAYYALSKTPGVSTVKQYIVTTFEKTFEDDTVGQAPTSQAGEIYAVTEGSAVVVADETAPLGLTKSLKFTNTDDYRGGNCYNNLLIKYPLMSTVTEQEFYIKPENIMGTIFTFLGNNMGDGWEVQLADGSGRSTFWVSFRVVAFSMTPDWHKIKFHRDSVSGVCAFTLDDGIPVACNDYINSMEVDFMWFGIQSVYSLPGGAPAIYLAAPKFTTIVEE